MLSWCGGGRLAVKGKEGGNPSSERLSLTLFSESGFEKMAGSMEIEQKELFTSGKTLFVKDLKTGQTLDGPFALTHMALKTFSGGKFLQAKLGDRTGRIAAVIQLLQEGARACLGQGLARRRCRVPAFKPLPPWPPPRCARSRRGLPDGLPAG